MKCPLTMCGLGSYSKNVMVEPRDCLKEKCAWWNKDGESCSIFLLTLGLGALLEWMSKIAEKLPEREES